ncbi:hypothetical protein GGI23_001505 [Coemansia sp. RSA 2559]|nr:hypothetical protein GGI23_001505 [Coemansia sp. RSA 2559]KAJ2861363.1 hypothetical protein GGI22_002475 [Coemansia erecta]
MRLFWICILAFLTLTYAYPLRIRSDLDKGDGSDLQKAIYDEALDDIGLDPNIADALDAFDKANDISPQNKSPDDLAADSNVDSADDTDANAEAVDTGANADTADDTDANADAVDAAASDTVGSAEQYADDDSAANIADQPHQEHQTTPVVAVVYVPKPLTEPYESLSASPDVPSADIPPVVVPANAAVHVALLPGKEPGPQDVPAQPIHGNNPEDYVTGTSMLPPAAAPGQVPDHQSQTGQAQAPEDDGNVSQSKDDVESVSTNPLSGLLQGLSNGISGLFQGLQGLVGTGSNDLVPDDDASPVEQPLLPQ